MCACCLILTAYSMVHAQCCAGNAVAKPARHRNTTQSLIWCELLHRIMQYTTDAFHKQSRNYQLYNLPGGCLQSTSRSLCKTLGQTQDGQLLRSGRLHFFLRILRMQRRPTSKLAVVTSSILKYKRHTISKHFINTSSCSEVGSKTITSSGMRAVFTAAVG